jgi:hypothetical protein
MLVLRVAQSVRLSVCAATALHVQRANVSGVVLSVVCLPAQQQRFTYEPMSVESS